MRAFRIAYDGTPYYGYRRQPDVPTVEDEIFDALRELGVLEFDADKPAGYAAAGRTDAGVSALSQTIALEAPDWLTPRAFNGGLPADVRAWASAEPPADFHATHHASAREYTYHLYAPLEGDAGEFDTPVEDGRFQEGLEALSGTHDVHNLTPDDHNTERTLELEATRDGVYLVVTVRAGGFCRELVRRLVSLAHAVGTGEEPLSKIDHALSIEPLPGHEGIAPAPAEPLVLTHVEYPDLEFSVDEEAAKVAREIFDRRRRNRRTRTRVSRQLSKEVRDDRE